MHLALWERLQHRSYDSYREYYNLLKYHPEGRLELRELFDLITIGETYFFRNKAQFDVLLRFVLPEIIQRKVFSGGKSLRVWSAGCSGGNESYSIAIAIMESVPSFEGWNISILGTDINRNGLNRAKEAIYGERDINQLPKEYLDKYFEIQGSTYLLKTDVKKLVQFEYHNLAKDPFTHEKMQDLDMIFCRNVIIYFNGQTTQQVIDNFYNCLSPHGYLFLGHTETLWQITNKFESIEFPHTFIHKKGVIPVQKETKRPLMTIPEVGFENLAHSKTPIFETNKKKSFLPPEPPKEESNKLRGKPRPHTHLSSLTRATLLANEAKYKEAADILAKIIAEDNLSVEAYYFLGVLLYKCSDFKGAETQFRKVIYINPDSVLAYFNLGNIYLYQRRIREATREFRNVIRLLEKRPKGEQVRFCEDFTPDLLLRACRKNLAEISQRGNRYE